MIQRIQTVYLLIAIFLTGSLFFLPYSELTNSKGELFLLDAKGLYPTASSNFAPLFVNMALLVLCAASISLMIITIFRFKSLSRQIVLAKLSLGMLLIFSGVFYYEIWKAVKLLQGAYSLKIYAAFPVVAMILTLMSIRGIRKDHQLIRSIDRIR